MSKQKLKVLQVTHDLNIGGLQKLVVDIALNIDRSRFDIAVCCLRELGPMADALIRNGIPVHEINQVVDGKTNYFSFIDVYRLLKKESVDIIHTHNTNPFIDGGVASLIAGTPVRIHTDHARAYPDKKRYMVAERVLSGLYDKVVAVSDQTRNDLIEFVKIRPDKLITIRNGVSSRVEDGSDVINESSAKGKFIIGTVGRLCKAKGYEYLIKAIPGLIKHAGNIELQIVGGGELKGELSSLISELGLEDHVRLVGETDNVDAYYKIFDLFVISSVNEGLPLVLLEAMANRVPVITTDVGGISDVVKHDYSACIVEPANTVALADGMWNLMRDDSARKKLALNAFDEFERHFSIDVMINKYQNLYLDCYENNAD